MAPPPPRQEVMTPQPSPNHFWIRGDWSWNGREYVWEPGHWEMRHDGWQWVPAHWEHTATTGSGSRGTGRR